MNIVFIGAGHVFGHHAEQFRRNAPKGSKFFVVEPDDEVAKQLYSDYKRIALNEAIAISNLAIVMTPSGIRWEVCKPFIDKEIPIVVEKPLTINWNEIQLFEEAAKTSWICPIVNIRMLSKIQKMKKEFVPPDTIESWKIRGLSKDYYSGWHGKYATDGGVLAQQGFHCLDLVCWIGGTPISVKAKGSRNKHNIECEDTAEVEIEFENGSIGKVYCTTAAKEKGLAGLRIGDKVTEAFQFASGKAGHTILAEKIYQSLKTDDNPPITVESAITSIRALHACYVSMDNDGMKTPLGQRHQKLGEQC